MMPANHNNPPRRLLAKVGLLGRIIVWTCTACNWTKVPEDPLLGATYNTQRAFESHKCEEHSVDDEREYISDSNSHLES